MHTKIRPCLLFMLTFGLLPAISGCTSSGGSEWKWKRCYEGPRRDLADVSVLLVARRAVPLLNPVALRIRSIDGERVREATEYHMLPGDHVVVSEPEIPRNFRIEYRDDACAFASEPTGDCGTGDLAATLTLEPGVVYRLTADLAWQREEPNRVYWKGRHGKWFPRVETLGNFEAVKDALAHRRERVRAWCEGKQKPPELGSIPWWYTALLADGRPPKHWASAEDDE